MRVAPPAWVCSNTHIGRGNLMSTASLGQKISWFLYQKGMGVAKPDYLFMVKLGEPKWFEIADILFKDKNLEGRSLVVDQLLDQKIIKSHPKRTQFLRLLGQYISKGILDERRQILKYVDDHTELFSVKDEVIFGPIMTAQRDGDVIIANTAESIVNKLRPEPPPDTRRAGSFIK